MISPNSFSGSLETAPHAIAGADPIKIANPATLYDAELVRRFKSGDEEAFVEIVARHRVRMLSAAFGHLRNHADAEEIAQDTFVRAYRCLANFRGESSLSSWLYRIAFNLSRNRQGYFSRRHRHETDSFDCPLGDNNTATVADYVASNNPDPMREETNREFLAQVTLCMGKLSVRQREILTLRNHMEQSYEEIAETLGLSQGTVKSRIARARKNLRDHLAHFYGEFIPSPSATIHWFNPIRSSGRLQQACA